LLEKITIFRQLGNFPHFCKPNVSLPLSEQPTRLILFKGFNKMPCTYTLNTRSMAICEVSQDTKFRTHFSVTLDVQFLSCFISPFFRENLMFSWSLIRTKTQLTVAVFRDVALYNSIARYFGPCYLHVQGNSQIQET
jgi:hypothetical protein